MLEPYLTISPVMSRFPASLKGLDEMARLKQANVKNISQADLLRELRQDIKELDWEKVGADGVTALVSKPAVLEIIQDWIEYVLAPNESA